MTIKKLTTTVAALAFLAFASLQVHGFVNQNDDTPYVEDTSIYMELIEGIAEDLESDKAIDQIDDAIAELDDVLDAEPANEGEILELRDALVELRTQAVGEMAEGVENQVDLVGSVAGAVAAPASIGFAPASTCTTCSSGGVVSSGGGGGGISLGGGLNWRRIGLIGGLVAGLASIDGDDDDTPVQSVGMMAN